MNAPLQPLGPYERLGWLRHFSAIRCKRDIPGSFTKGKDYPLTVESIRQSHNERKTRTGGARESVTLTGRGLMITLKADNGWRHRFLAEPRAEHPLLHNFQFLVEHFTVPQIPDVARLQPKAFETYKARLRALET